MNLKKACSLRSFTPVACLVAAAVAPSALPTRAAVVSEPVTASKWTLSLGASFIAPPVRAIAAYSGKVASVVGNTVTLAGSPGWTVNQFGPQNVAGQDFYQYMMIVRNDRSADGPGTRGDWFLVESNAAGALTVKPDAFGTAASRVAWGDVVEVIKLNSVKDLFGAGPTLRLGADSDFDDATPDTIRIVAGTSFVAALFYHDGSSESAGWYYDYQAAGDGSLLTLYPDQAVMVFRGGGPTDLHVAGNLASFTLSHYLAIGPNPLGTGFGAPTPLNISGLQEAGFLDTDFDDATEDTLRLVTGTSFGDPIFYHNSGGTVEPTGWYVNYTLNPTFPLNAGAGLMVFVNNLMVWRQNPPFVP